MLGKVLGTYEIYPAVYLGFIHGFIHKALGFSLSVMITLYDIPSKLDDKAWSPNTLKTRVSLNYKGIPYKTEWVEYPDIAPVLKRIGGAPTRKKADGSDLYTLPAILDSATGKVITDSLAIAEYLDTTYPETPLLFPPGSRTAIAVLEHAFMQSVEPLFNAMLPATSNVLNPISEAYVQSTYGNEPGKKLEEIDPPGPFREGRWKQAKENLDVLARLYDKNGEDKLFYFADTFSFADAIVIAFLTWIKVVLGENNEEWRELASWSNGRWGKLIESTKKLQVVN